MPAERRSCPFFSAGLADLVFRKQRPFPAPGTRSGRLPCIRPDIGCRRPPPISPRTGAPPAPTPPAKSTGTIRRRTAAFGRGHDGGKPSLLPVDTKERAHQRKSARKPGGFRALFTFCAVSYSCGKGGEWLRRLWPDAQESSASPSSYSSSFAWLRDILFSRAKRMMLSRRFLTYSGT